MASVDPAVIPFGLRAATPEALGLLARRLMEAADAAIRRSRPRAALMILPFLLFYVLYAGLLGLVLWGLGIHLSPPLFLALTAAAFSSMALLGQYYRAGEMEVEGDMPRVLAVMVLQAYILRAFTWFFFVIPYLAFRNLTRLFPRRARVSPEVVEVAVQVGAALDTPVAVRTLALLLPPAFPLRALEEALVLLEWAGVAARRRAAAGIIVQPGPLSGGLAAALPQQAEITPLSWVLAEPVGGEEPAEEPVPAPLPPTPGWVRWMTDHPGRSVAVFGGGAAVLFILFLLFQGWYRRLPVRLERPTLPHGTEATGFSFAEGRFAVCAPEGVDLYAGLGTAPEESYSLDGLKLVNLAPAATRPVPPTIGGREPEMEIVWNAPAERNERVSFQSIYSAVPDPGGYYLLVYGEWGVDRGPGSHYGRLGVGVVDLEEGTFTPEEQFGGWGLKGWWEDGLLLGVQSSRTWDQGGGTGPESSNLSGTMAALDPATGEASEIRRPGEAYFGLAGNEKGQRIFLAAQWKSEETRRRARCFLTEYREFQKIGSFSLTLRQFRPFLYDARLDATGRYWILAFGSPPGLMEMDKGTLYTVWIVSRNGGRMAQVLEARRDKPYLFSPFTYRGRSMLSFLTGSRPPVLSIREIVR